MAFLAKCIIHKSEPKIWRILSETGLKRNPFIPVLKPRTGHEPMCVAVGDGQYYNVREGENPGDDFVDCGTDENLFYALAALRDDTDQDQVFIYDDRDWNNSNPTRFWFKCHALDVADDMPFYGMSASCTKANVSELLYHFRGMDDDDCYGDDVKPMITEYDPY